MSTRITIRLPDELMSALRAKAGNEPLADYCRRVLARHVKMPAPEMPQGFAATKNAAEMQQASVAARKKS